MGYNGYHEDMRIPYRKEKKFSPKLLGLIVLILVVAVAAFISSSPASKKEESSGISGFLVDLSDKSLSLNSLFTSYGLLDFNISKTDTVVLKTAKPTNFKLSGEEIDVSDLSSEELTLTNFQGKIKIKDRKATIDGVADSLYLNTIGISKRRSTIKLDSDFDSLRVSNIQLFDQDVSELKGDLSVSEKTKLSLDDGKLTIKTFKGNVFVNGNLTVSGLADKISVKNDGHDIEISE